MLCETFNRIKHYFKMQFNGCLVFSVFVQENLHLSQQGNNFYNLTAFYYYFFPSTVKQSFLALLFRFPPNCDLAILVN